MYDTAEVKKKIRKGWERQDTISSDMLLLIDPPPKVSRTSPKWWRYLGSMPSVMSLWGKFYIQVRTGFHKANWEGEFSRLRFSHPK